MRVDQAGGDDGGFQDTGAVGNVRFGGRADPFDLAVGAGDHDGVLDRRPRDGVQGLRPHRHLGGCRSAGQSRHGDE